MSKFLSSTGEPPTLLVEGTASESKMDETEKLRSQSLEADSGYEASPCSTGDNTSSDHRHFFGEESPGPSTANASAANFEDPATDREDVFENVDYPLLEPDVIPVDYRSSSPSISDRPESSATHRCCSSSPECCSTATSRFYTPVEDNCDCDSSVQSSPIRPSSLPIQIPGRVRNSDTSLDNPSPLQRRHRTEPPPSPSVSHSLLPVSHSLFGPVSWPPPFVQILARNERLMSLERPLERLRPNRSWSQSNRRRIDSDAESSTSCESDDFEPDEVFRMAEEDEPSPPPAWARTSDPLPDLLLHSSPATGRRNRSVSINLPLESEVANAGRILRRLSDQFEQGQFSRQRRRQTIDVTPSFGKS